MINMKISEVADKINVAMANEAPNFTGRDTLTTTRINGYNKMGFITPVPKKAKNKSYFEYEQIHLDLVLRAYKKIVVNKMRSREAFQQAREEIASPSLF